MRAITRTGRIQPSGQVQKPLLSPSRRGPCDFRSRSLPSGFLRRLLSLVLPPLTILAIADTETVPTAQAVSPTVIFGPQRFERATGAPQLLEATFSVCDPTGQFWLAVANGDADGSHRASSARIWINGAEVLGPDRLNQRVGGVEATVEVRGGENQIRVQLASQPGARITVSIEAAISCLQVRIQEPASGAQIADRVVLVRGEVEPAEGEIGATVNGLVAPVVQGQFAILVPLVPGENRIQARVADQNGNRADDIIVVRADLPPGEPPLDLDVFPQEGLAPLTVNLRAVLRGPSPQANLAVDFDGDGLAEQSGPGVDGAAFSYSQEGVYVIRVVQTNPDGSQATGRLVVNVIPRPDLEDKWHQMRTILAAGDIERALSFFLAGSREQYRKQFTALANAGALPEVANELGNLLCNRFLPGAAECDLRVVRSGKEYSFPALFERDGDGIWRIRSF